MAFREPSNDGPIYMLNFMKYHAVAQYADGTGEQISGMEADDRYAPVDILADLGAYVSLFGNVVSSSEDWDRLACVCYPTRKSFIDMQSRSDFAEKHEHKAAGMHHTTIVGLQPVGAMPPATRGRLLVELWKGDEPAPLPGTTPVAFAVEGTIIGDGRDWSGARLSPLADDAVLDVPAGSPEYIVTEIRAVINEWR
jgi:hypothetical protein